jgi:predicted nucleic acid-binding protein
VIFDTDVLIYIERGNAKAATLFDRQRERLISVQTYMEWLQGARDRKHLAILRSFLKDHNVHTLPFSEEIGYKASTYVEEYFLSHHLSSGDALIAATAICHNLPLASSNKKHFSAIQELDFYHFIP